MQQRISGCRIPSAPHRTGAGGRVCRCCPPGQAQRLWEPLSLTLVTGAVVAVAGTGPRHREGPALAGQLQLRLIATGHQPVAMADVGDSSPDTVSSGPTRLFQPRETPVFAPIGFLPEQWLTVRAHCGGRTSTPQPCPSGRGGAGQDGWNELMNEQAWVDSVPPTLPVPVGRPSWSRSPRSTQSRRWPPLGLHSCARVAPLSSAPVIIPADLYGRTAGGRPVRPFILNPAVRRRVSSAYQERRGSCSTVYQHARTDGTKPTLVRQRLDVSSGLLRAIGRRLGSQQTWSWMVGSMLPSRSSECSDCPADVGTCSEPQRRPRGPGTAVGRERCARATGGCGTKRPPCADGVSPDVCDLTCVGAGSRAEVRLSLAELMELEVPPSEWTERILGPVRDRAAAGAPAELDDLDRQFWYVCVGAVCDRLGNHTPAMQVYVLGFGREPGPVPRLPATRGLARCGFSVEIVFRVIVGRFRAVSGVSSGDQGREGCPCCG